LKNVGPIHHCEPPHANSPDVASGTVAYRLRIDVHDDIDNDNEGQRGPLWPHEMGPKIELSSTICVFYVLCILYSTVLLNLHNITHSFKLFFNYCMHVSSSTNPYFSLQEF